MKSKPITKHGTPQWQLIKMQAIIASHWDETWQIVNLKASLRNRNNY